MCSGASAASVARAAELAGLSGLLARLLHGLKTPVGENGLRLSAGERQRIAIARAVLRDSPIVLLDEPTAHLDADRELWLARSLEPWLENRTVVLAAHRLGLLWRVDREIVLLDGRLSAREAGLHGTLYPIGAGR